MQEIRFGKIIVVPGQNGARFPHNTALLIDDDLCAVIDPGAEERILLEIRNDYPVEMVLNTHYHFDHIVYNHLFPDARIVINEIDSECFRDRRELARRLGMVDCFGENWTDAWLDRIKNPNAVQSPYSPQNRHEWWLSTARLDGTYRWGDTFDFGTTKLKVVGAPGHTAGFNCFYFPEEGLVYTGDIDLTDFGPWYAGRDGNIDQFIESARDLCNLDADIFVTGHEVGIINKSAYILELERYLNIIEERDRKVLNILPKPMTLKEITEFGLFYGKRFLVDDWIRAWEEMMVRKHLERLIGLNKIKKCEKTYSRE